MRARLTLCPRVVCHASRGGQMKSCNALSVQAVMREFLSNKSTQRRRGASP